MPFRNVKKDSSVPVYKKQDLRKGELSPEDLRFRSLSSLEGVSGREGELHPEEILLIPPPEDQPED